MSNSSIVERLSALADEFESGRIPLSTVANQLVGHAEALERMDYRQVKEAQVVQAQLLQAVEAKQERHIDRSALLEWLRAWIKKVPIEQS